MTLSKTSKDRIKKSGKKKLSNYEIQEAYDDARVAREFGRFKPVRLSARQQELYDGIGKNVVTTVTGPAGTSKTFVACHAAIEAFRRGEVKKIYLVKPLETSGEDTGFLPGDLDEKTRPFMQSFLDNLTEMVGKDDLGLLMQTRVIEFVPLAFMRGRTLRDSFILADEIQNLDVKQIMTLVTRIGRNSRMVLIGDQAQNDINRKYLAFDFFIEHILADDPDVYHFRFTRDDIVRHPMLVRLVDRYEAAKGSLPETKNRN